MKCRLTYAAGVHDRLSVEDSMAAKTVIIEVVTVPNYHRKYAIHVLDASKVRGC